MSRSRSMSIRTRLTLLSLLTILAPIGGALLIVAWRDVRDIRTEMVSSSLLVGYVVSEYSASAMNFDDKTAAEQTLKGLANVSNVIAAALYNSNGRQFAAYRPGSLPAGWSVPERIVPPTLTRTELGQRYLVVFQPVLSRGVRSGTLVLWVTTEPLRSRTRAYLWSLGLLGVGALIAAALLAVMLERTVARPLSRLARVARTIAETEDYSVRAHHLGGDEIGMLGNAFNQMLTEVAGRQQQAQQAIQVRDDFLSVASHELKTPLTSLQLQVQGVLTLPPKTTDSDAERMKQTFGIIQRQVMRLDRLIGNLLDVSRIAAGRMVLDLGEVDLAAIVEDVANHFEPELKRHQCVLQREIQESIVGRWDATRLDQVVTNLLSNAIKYGGGKPIVLRCEADDERARVVVSDHGIGIAADDQNRIFDRFERAAGLGYGGLGLGLFISRQIVVAHGGSVRVESAPNRGSTFIVELPRAGRAEEEAS